MESIVLVNRVEVEWSDSPQDLDGVYWDGDRDRVGSKSEASDELWNI